MEELIVLISIYSQRMKSNYKNESSSGRLNRLLRQHDAEIDSWRIFKVMAEFVKGFEFLSQFDRSVTFFGTARCDFSDKIYREAEELAAMLAREGFSVVTGGGPGVMQAANKGASEASGESIGLNIMLPHEQRINEYVHKSEAFSYFFTRKVMLSFSSEAYIYFPGGFGTLDEFFEITTLIQTNKIEPLPVVLVNKKFWTPLLTWIEDTVYGSNRAIDKEDTRIYYLVDTAEEAFDYLIKRLNP